MKLTPVNKVEDITHEDFKQKYYDSMKPLVIKGLSKEWPAYNKWNWNYFKEVVGETNVAVYNNIKNDAYTPVNKADDRMRFGDYLNMVEKGPVGLRIFLFNIFQHAPQLVNDFIWPEHLMNGFVKRFPMLFVGGAGSVTHMHFDIDLSHIIHTQFAGRKRVLLFPNEEQFNLYRKPWEVMSFVDFENYSDKDKNKLQLESFPALGLARGYETILEHGETLFMPAGYWHHMEYLDSGFAMSLRAMQPSLSGKIHGAWNLFGMRTIDTFMKKTAPLWWYNYKKSKTFSMANNQLKEHLQYAISAD
ncbi:MAG: cupin-like domain-containing protein [Chitinophagaceae bacterium]|nr:cupin-like domain-containing protein [Chitinophagaceae bacterium]